MAYYFLLGVKLTFKPAYFEKEEPGNFLLKQISFLCLVLVNFGVNINCEGEENSKQGSTNKLRRLEKNRKISNWLLPTIKDGRVNQDMIQQRTNLPFLD